MSPDTVGLVLHVLYFFISVGKYVCSSSTAMSVGLCMWLLFQLVTLCNNDLSLFC